jgi:hypothetical protein
MGHDHHGDSGEIPREDKIETLWKAISGSAIQAGDGVRFRDTMLSTKEVICVAYFLLHSPQSLP